jgi:hypothetical protein
MNGYKLLIIPCLALATALSWGAGQSRAESQDAPTNGTVSTGSFRDPENVPKLRSTTQSQREEAARKAAEYRAEAARAAALKKAAPIGVAPYDSTVPPTTQGGTNE